MKLDIFDDKYIYFTNINFDLCEDNISIFLKDMFLNIGEIYGINLYGFYKVDIYYDKKIGFFVEIEKIDEYIPYSKKIDTKVTISSECFYFKSIDLSYFSNYKNIYYLDNFYYVLSSEVEDIYSLMEVCEIEYNPTNLKLV